MNDPTKNDRQGLSCETRDLAIGYGKTPLAQQIALGVILVVSVFADVHMNTRKRA